MEERLKGLRQSMKKTIYQDLHFTNQLQNRVLEKIHKQKETDEEIILAIMQLLISEKNGYELSKLLRGRGIKRFEDNEGFLYTIIHRLEQQQYICSRWDEDSGKLYLLNDKGRKVMQKAEKQQQRKQIIFRELLEG